MFALSQEVIKNLRNTNGHLLYHTISVEFVGCKDDPASLFAGEYIRDEDDDTSSWIVV